MCLSWIQISWRVRRNTKLSKEVRNWHGVNRPITCQLLFSLAEVSCHLISDILDEGSSDSGEEGDGSDDDEEDEEENEEDGEGETAKLTCWDFLA